MTVIPVPCLETNFAYIVPFGDGRAALVDAPEAGPILAALEERDLRLAEVWITHHHPDHVDGVPDLRARHDFRIFGNAHDAERLPPLDVPLTPGTGATMAGHDCAVIDVPGHTIGHVAFHVPGLRAAFTADSLMALGCGRLFEGMPEMMWESLARMAAAFGDGDVVYQGHDYLDTNIRFARDTMPPNPALDERVARIEAAKAETGHMPHETYGIERTTNPFLRAALGPVKEHLGMADAADAEVFAELRRRRDGY